MIKALDLSFKSQKNTEAYKKYEQFRNEKTPIDLTKPPQDIDRIVLSKYRTKEALRVTGLLAIIPVVGSLIALDNIKKLKKENSIKELAAYSKNIKIGGTIATAAIALCGFITYKNNVKSVENNFFTKRNIYQKQGFNV